MLLGVAAFVFVLAVGKITRWRVHSHVCDNHLAILPTPFDAESSGGVFGYGAALFDVAALTKILFFWQRRRQDSTTATENSRRGGGLAPPRAPRRAVAALSRWGTDVATTFSVVLFGRRVVVTSAPALARRVLHTHFKLYAKDPVNDPNSQAPALLHSLMPNCERALFSRPDAKDRTPHGAARTSFAQALLRTAYDGPVLRAAVRKTLAATLGAMPSTGPTLSATLPNIRAVVVESALSMFAQQYLSAAPTSNAELVLLLTEALEMIDQATEEPWRRYVARVLPATRRMRAQLDSSFRPVATAVMKAVASGSGADDALLHPPLAAFAKGQLPTEPSVTMRDAVQKAVADSLTAELITTALFAAGPMTDAVAWALHYLAMPQNYALVAHIEDEAAANATTVVRNGGMAADEGAERRPGAVEVLREVLRLHPPVPVVTRTAVNDDLVAVSDIGVANDRLEHKLAAQLDATNAQSFTQRSGCVVLPSSCLIVINMEALLRRTDVFGADAASFSPRRFVAMDSGLGVDADGVATGGGRDRTDPRVWFSAGGFGIGARGCPAAHWVQPVAAEILRAVVASFKLQSPPTVAPKKAVTGQEPTWSVVLTPRNSKSD